MPGNEVRYTPKGAMENFVPSETFQSKAVYLRIKLLHVKFIIFIIKPSSQDKLWSLNMLSLPELQGTSFESTKGFSLFMIDIN